MIRSSISSRVSNAAQRNKCFHPMCQKRHFENLPYSPGVYYFHNEKGKIIYVGKAKNIRYRVNSHFSSNLDSRQKQNFIRYTYAISFHTCGTELMAHILESSEINVSGPFLTTHKKDGKMYTASLHTKIRTVTCDWLSKKIKNTWLLSIAFIISWMVIPC